MVERSRPSQFGDIVERKTIRVQIDSAVVIVAIHTPTNHLLKILEVSPVTGQTGEQYVPACAYFR